MQVVSGYDVEGLLSGHELVGVSASASGTDYGTYSSEVLGKAVILDGQEDVTQNYVITKTASELKIDKRDITIKANSDTFVYNNANRTVSGYTTENLVSGHSISGVSASRTEKNVNNYPVVVQGTAIIQDADGNIVTGNYNIGKQEGMLTITPASIALSITGKSDTKTYNGEEQSLGGYDVVGLLGGHTLEGITAQGAGTDFGDYAVKVLGTPVVMDGDVAVTKNYVIAKNDGTLSIEKKELTVTANSDETLVYNGQEQTVSGYKVEGLIDGHTLSGLSASRTETAAASYSISVEGVAAIADSNGDVTGNYEIKTQPGNMLIAAKEVNIAADNKVIGFGDAMPELSATVSGWDGDLNEIGYTLS